MNGKKAKLLRKIAEDTAISVHGKDVYDSWAYRDYNQHMTKKFPYPDGEDENGNMKFRYVPLHYTYTLKEHCKRNAYVSLKKSFVKNYI